MKTIFSVMQHEHKIIKTAIDALMANAEQLEEGAGVNEEFYMQAIFFLRNYADKIHYSKEEDILFSTSLKNENTKDNPDVKLLVHQHILSRGLIDLMEEALANRNTKKLINVSKEYSEIIGAHIIREDEILLPLLEKDLPEPVKSQIIMEFEDIDNKYSSEEIKKLEESALKLKNLIK